MVRVAMGDKNGINGGNGVCESLLPEIRGNIDQDVLSRNLDQYGGPCSTVFGVVY